jgi:uncharacterized protein YdiU (UPF0061 family)
LGLRSILPEDETNLIIPLLKILEKAKLDYTIFFRLLCDLNHTERNPQTHNQNPIDSMFEQADLSEERKASSVSITAPPRQDSHISRWNAWRQEYIIRLQKENWVSLEEKQTYMKRVNPKFVLRQWIAQETIELAEKGDKTAVARALSVFSEPFSDDPESAQAFVSELGAKWYEKWAQEPPAWGKGIVCSCSS